MYQLAITRNFIAQHRLIGGDWGAENQLHSHHYQVEILLRGTTLDEHGYLVDIVEVEHALSGVIEQFRDHALNELKAFHALNPSLERFAHLLWTLLNALPFLAGKLKRVKLWENKTDYASYGQE
jgi:6-pyruvoyltetrahydropterin/6-carboxytetrahydropterin synthase